MDIIQAAHVEKSKVLAKGLGKLKRILSSRDFRQKSTDYFAMPLILLILGEGI